MNICTQCGNEQLTERDYCDYCGSPISQRAIRKYEIARDAQVIVPLSAYFGYFIWIALTLASPLSYYVSKKFKLIPRQVAENISLAILIIGLFASVIFYFYKSNKNGWLSLIGIVTVTLLLGFILWIYLVGMVVLIIGK